MRVRVLGVVLGAVASVGAVPVAAYAAGCTGLPAHGTAPVVDAANVIPPAAEAALAADLLRYHRAGNEAIVAAAVHDLGGDDVASYATRLFDCWGVGDKGAGNGVLILVAMTEHRTRIELGAGLDGRIGDEDLSVAVESMTGPLRQGDVAGGLRAAAVAVADDLGTPLDATAAAPGSTCDSDTGDSTDTTDTTDQPGITTVGGPGVGVATYDSPFGSEGGSGFGLVVLVPLFFLVAIVGAVIRYLSGGGGGSVWRGGIPGYGAYGPWGPPAMLHRGRWADSGSSMNAGSMSALTSMSGSMSSPSSFGGGSSGGGGASGSW